MASLKGDKHALKRIRLDHVQTRDLTQNHIDVIIYLTATRTLLDHKPMIIMHTYYNLGYICNAMIDTKRLERSQATVSELSIVLARHQTLIFNQVLLVVRYEKSMAWLLHLKASLLIFSC
ncbi:hypothetical protein H5410_016099 [Solanum commersonii]|uniref:Uncharacterized protein n=1 Tax=Solanum commersonii TaxID=4109 RepID=A0A9J5ZW24_SOLCO|nr:hypothetical protein H5410_016099 [Solanum commersonii]